MPLIKKTVKEKVENHDHKEALITGVRGYSESLLKATKKAEKITKKIESEKASASHTQKEGSAHKHHSKFSDMFHMRDDAAKSKTNLIDKKIEKEIKNSGHEVAIKNLLEEITPQLFATFYKVTSTDTKSAVEEHKVVLGSLEHVGEIMAEEGVKKLISPKVKAELKKHPEQEILKKNINSFVVKQLIPIVNNVVSETPHGENIAKKTPETTAYTGKGKEAVKVASSTVEKTAKEASSVSKAMKVAPVTKLLTPDLNQQIEEHPFRDAVQKFFKYFLPKILKSFEKVALPTLETMATDAVKKALPGATGEFAADLTNKAIKGATKVVKENIEKPTNSEAPQKLDAPQVTEKATAAPVPLITVPLHDTTQSGKVEREVELEKKIGGIMYNAPTETISEVKPVEYVGDVLNSPSEGN